MRLAGDTLERLPRIGIDGACRELRCVRGEAEAAIQHGMDELMAGRTTIAVAHRLSTIVRATEILVLHHGEVRERGTHRELLDAGGLYERLYRLQVGVLAESASSV